jgi:hypothetical protein
LAIRNLLMRLWITSMPASRSSGEGLATELADLYRGLETELASGIARRLTPGIETQRWAAQRLAAVGEVRRWATGLAERASGRAGPAAARAVAAAFRRGSAEALRDLGRPDRGGYLPGQRGLDRLAGALAGRLDNAAFPIARSAVDAYQRTVATAAASVLGGAQTRRAAAQQAWNRQLDQGFTAFTDARGRRWSAAGYTEMATRTATAQAAVQGHLDRLESLGLDLVIVSDAPQECKLCRPWEGKVLQRAGAGGRRTITAESELNGEPVTVQVAGSVAEAVGAGLMHPNCRHTMTAYLPGLTRTPTNTEDPEGDAARQRLRYLEREQRRWKLREAGALDDAERAKAAAKVRARQAEIRAHVKENPTLTRRSDREQIDLANRRFAQQRSTPEQYAARAEGAAREQAALDAPELGMSRPGQLAGAPRRALYDYSGWNYRGINAVFRGTVLPYGADERELSGLARLVRAAFTRSALRSDAALHRGVGNARAMFGDRLDGDLTGLEWRELAPSSTSARARVAEGFTGSGNDAVIMRILAPRGTPAIELSGMDTEAEVLLGPGERFRVVRDRGRDAGGRRRIDVEVVR